MALSRNMLYVMSKNLDNIKILGQVIKFAKEHSASLTLLDVIESLPRSSRMLITSVPTIDLRDDLVNNRLEELEALVARFRSDSVALRPRVRFGNQARQIAHEADEGGYDLVIKSPGKSRMDKYLQRHCSCPVWLLKPDDYDASGQLVPNCCPQIAGINRKPAMEYRMQTSLKSRASWVTRAQALFR